MKLDPLAAQNAFPNLLLAQARARPAETFLRDVDRGEAETYGEFEAKVRVWASRLAGLGCGKATPSWSCSRGETAGYESGGGTVTP